LGLKVTREALSQTFDITPQTLTKYARVGMPVDVTGRSGQANVYDTAACYRWLVQYELQRRTGSTGQVLNLDAERARLTKAQADHEELKTRRLAGELISHEDVTRGWCAIIGAARARLLGLPAKLQSRFPDMPAEAREELDVLVRETLDELARDDGDGLIATDWEGDGGMEAAPAADTQ